MAIFQLFFQSGRAKDLSVPLYNTTHSRIHTTVQNKLAAACKSNGRLFTNYPYVLMRPQRKTVNRKTSIEMLEYRNSPIVMLLVKEDDDD